MKKGSTGSQQHRVKPADEPLPDLQTEAAVYNYLDRLRNAPPACPARHCGRFDREAAIGSGSGRRGASVDF